MDDPSLCRFWLSLSLRVAVAAAPVTLWGCDDAPTTAVVENGYPGKADGGATTGAVTVYKAWWGTTLFGSPVGPGLASDPERTVPGSDFAYALLAPGWSLEATSPPVRLVAAKSMNRLKVSAHTLLSIVVSDETFVGNCSAGQVLGDEDARFIVDRIFASDFGGSTYDPATCATNPLGADAGGDSASP